MKLATRDIGSRDGRLVVVADDLSRMEDAEAASTLQGALDDWPAAEPALRRQCDALNAGRGVPYDAAKMMAAIPRSFQFLDASAFLAHNHILADAWGYARRTEADPPLMYQGLSDRFYSPSDAIPFRSEADNIDFEAEFAVIVDWTPQGVSAQEALQHVKLVVLLNDWSLRSFGPAEMRAGFGFVHAKPPSSMSAVAVTPDTLGDSWRDGRLALPLQVRRGSTLFGAPEGGAMSYSFGELIAHAATTRELCAGTVIGSGTVSNFDASRVGSGCIAERQALEALTPGGTATPYLRFGERVRLEALDAAGRSIFGALDQVVVAASSPGARP